MDRTPLLVQLRKYSSVFSEELIYKKQITHFIEANPRCFERSLKEGHITASSWLVNKNNSAALLMRHKKMGIWCQLGGHADGESDPLKVALKEAKEESGIDTISPISKEIFDIDIYLCKKRGSTPAHLHYDIRFLLQVLTDASPKTNHESRAFLWISKDPSSLPTREKSILRMHQKWQLLDLK